MEWRRPDGRSVFRRRKSNADHFRDKDTDSTFPESYSLLCISRSPSLERADAEQDLETGGSENPHRPPVDIKLGMELCFGFASHNAHNQQILVDFRTQTCVSWEKCWPSSSIDSLTAVRRLTINSK